MGIIVQWCARGWLLDCYLVQFPNYLHSDGSCVTADGYFNILCRYRTCKIFSSPQRSFNDTGYLLTTALSALALDPQEAPPCFLGRIPTRAKAPGTLGWQRGTSSWHIGTSACTRLHAAPPRVRSVSGSQHLFLKSHNRGTTSTLDAHYRFSRWTGSIDCVLLCAFAM